MSIENDAPRATVRGEAAAEPAGWLFGNSFYESNNPRTPSEVKKFGRALYNAPTPALVSPRAADAPSEPSEPAMRAALERIARWHGEFPDTGKTWPTGGAVSYAAEYGSHGERDYMRQIALDALKSRAADALDSQPTDGGK